MTQEINIPAGKLFCISRGEYSDYGYEGHFLALVNITRKTFDDVVAKINADMEANGVDSYGVLVPFAEAEDYCIRGHRLNKFLPELIRAGVVVDIDCVEIHTGSYSTLEY